MRVKDVEQLEQQVDSSRDRDRGLREHSLSEERTQQMKILRMTGKQRECETQKENVLHLHPLALDHQVF